MGLSPEEQKFLKKLQRKAEEPDAPSVGRTVNFNVNLDDPKQMAIAQREGWLAAEESGNDEEESEEDDEDETPQRRGYFKDN